MAINKVVYNTENGAKTLIDLTGDSVTPETLAEGATATNSAGERITGTMPTDVVRYGAQQTLTDAQQSQARRNIGIDYTKNSLIAEAANQVLTTLVSEKWTFILADGTAVDKTIYIGTSAVDEPS